jgi:23S rRNA (cytosine1962-C5)-methyltransferase
MLSFQKNAPDANFWIEKFKNALQVRHVSNLPSQITNAIRIVHGEGDGLPGLIDALSPPGGAGGGGGRTAG